MKLTPLDLQHHTFRKTMNGFDPKQVSAFLELVRTEWEDLLRESQHLKDKLQEMNVNLLKYKDNEKILQDTLVTAQRMVDDMKKTTQKEAEIVLGQAELQADKILHQAHERLTHIIDEIHELKRQRAAFEGELKGMLEAHFRLLDLQKETRRPGHIEDVGLLPKAM
jgi:cell division initiation protein